MIKHTKSLIPQFCYDCGRNLGTSLWAPDGSRLCAECEQVREGCLDVLPADWQYDLEHDAIEVSRYED